MNSVGLLFRDKSKYSVPERSVYEDEEAMVGAGTSSGGGKEKEKRTNGTTSH